jgi:hypothetical protein
MDSFFGGFFSLGRLSAAEFSGWFVIYPKTAVISDR